MSGRSGLFLLLCFLGFWAAGQGTIGQPTEIFGKVIDAKTKEALSDVNIKLIPSVRTTMSDPKGEYRIRTIDRIDSISFSYLGYRTRTVAVKRGTVQNLKIEMGSDELKLTEITVKTGKRHKRVVDTAANYVFYQVLKNKNLNRIEHIDHYKYENYEKLQFALLNPTQKFTNFSLFRPFHFAFENTDTTEEGNIYIPGIIIENISDVYYRKDPKRLKKYVHAEKTSGINNKALINLAQYQFAEINIYDNLFVFAQNSFLSPFAPTALATYVYYLTDTALIEGRVSYKLHFVGKVKQDLALKGYAWIDSATWAVKSVNLRPNEKANVNFLNDYTVKQEYTLVSGKDWLLKREELHGVGGLFKKNGKMSVMVTKLNTRRNFDTETIFPDSVFAGREERIIDDSARFKPKKYWDTARFEPLKRQELEVYHVMDSFLKVPRYKTYYWIGRILTHAFADAGPVSIGRILNMVSKNNVEGWRLRFGLETNQVFRSIGTPVNNFLRTFYLTGYIAYGLKDRIWQYQALSRINLPTHNDKWHSVEVMYRYDMRVPGQDEQQNLLTFDNIVTLIGGKPLSKIMRTREFRITHEKEWIKDFSTSIVLNDKVFYDIPGVFNFSRKEGDVIKHVSNFDVTEFTLGLRYSYRDAFTVNRFQRFFLPNRYPAFEFKYTPGLVNILGTYYNYHNLLFSVQQRLSSPIGHTLYWFRAAKIFGRAPYTAAFLTQGNSGILFDRFNYNLLREFEFVSDQYVSLWVEQHFDGFFFNKIPGFNRLKLRELIYMRSLFGTFDQRNADVLMVPAELHQPGLKPYMELGFGIENIFYLFRVDFMWRVTYRNQPGAPNWGVKIAFRPGF